MNRSYSAVLLCLLLLTKPLAEARRGGGASISRGGGAARGGVAGGNAGGGGFAPNQGGGFQRPGGGFQQPHPQQPTFNQGNQGQWNQGGSRGFGGPGFQGQPHINSQPHFTSGNSLGSPSRASGFKSALAGAAVGTIGGLLAFEAGKAIIRSATTPFNHDGRDYYFDRQNHPQNGNANMCAMPLQQLIATQAPAPTTTTTVAPVPAAGDAGAAPVTTTMAPQQVLQNIQFQDGTRPKEVVWSCKATEICCGTDCCPAPQNQAGAPNAAPTGKSGGAGIGGIILGILLILLILSCCCCFLVYKFCRESIECLIPKRREDNYYDDGTKYDGNGQGNAYPMGPYPPQQNYPPPPQYPQQGGYYPAQPQPPQGYPQYPHHQQF
ncbi:unnamed protein product [Bursaphelenchus xylophilus]|uniref:(pine wood nematode) hypothetical protein n=1 Tax=Bursaphelenchus xylophilus TaxID=6326 RepID=A0A1I7RV45_BURXY|nr:unnamed protein product [Bursaphelenchus xylophilus]CAG9105124.1 unnamed protein product [Bursaphelenchus xylophilus]